MPTARGHSAPLLHQCPQHRLGVRAVPLRPSDQPCHLGAFGGQDHRHWQPGNGLIGMRERVAECGGKLQLAADTGGLALQIWLPQAGVANV